MEEGKKAPSFLYSLYQRFQDSKTKAQEEASPEGILNAAEPPPPAPKESLTIPAPEQEAFSFLKPLFTYCQMLASDGKFQSELPKDLSAFHRRLTAPIRDLPVYAEKEADLFAFIKDLCLWAQVNMAKLTEEEENHNRAVDAIAQIIAAAGEEDASDAIKAAAKEPPVIPPLPPVDAAVFSKSIGSQMYGILFAVPPYREGCPLTEEMIEESLTDQKIISCLKEECIHEIAANSRYMQLFLIAEGIPAVNGLNGSILDTSSCRAELEILQDQWGHADFKNLNMFHSVKKDQEICQIVHAVAGSQGENIAGLVLPYKSGKEPLVPCGKNTHMAEDGISLLADIDGHLSYRSHKYQVEPLLVIPSNVDYSAGNVDFPGDVLIQGDVCNGFTVKASGSITVQGMAESATLIAGGDITIAKGINGNLTGSLHAGGDIKTSFLENCTVFSGGSIYASTIITCTISCEDSVYIQSGKGVIIGGSIVARNNIEARMIGSKGNRETNLFLGEIPGLLEKKNNLQKEISEADKVIEKLNLNINYLEKVKNSLPQDKIAILSQLKNQLVLYAEKRNENQENLQQLVNSATDFSHCSLKCNMVFPITKVYIGTQSYIVDSVLSKCCFFMGREGVTLGSIQ